MTKFLIGLVAALTLTVAGLGAYVVLGDDSAEAHAPMNCDLVVDTSTDPDSATATCEGAVHVDAPDPAPDLHFLFRLVVTFDDNDSNGRPSRGDTVTSCTLTVSNSLTPNDPIFDGPIHRGPCP